MCRFEVGICRFLHCLRKRLRPFGAASPGVLFLDSGQPCQSRRAPHHGWHCGVGFAHPQWSTYRHGANRHRARHRTWGTRYRAVRDAQALTEFGHESGRLHPTPPTRDGCYRRRAPGSLSDRSVALATGIAAMCRWNFNCERYVKVTVQKGCGLGALMKTARHGGQTPGLKSRHKSRQLPREAR